jgi:hypothetical protein
MRRMYAGVGGGEVISCLKTSLRSLMEFMALGDLEEHEIPISLYIRTV